MVLIVDDHHDIGRALVALMRTRRIDAVALTDPTLAAEAVAKLRPEVLILDQMMPGLSGTDLLRAIRANPDVSATPTVFYSAAEEGRAEAEALGAKAWVTKGRDRWAEILDVVQRLQAHA